MKGLREIHLPEPCRLTSYSSAGFSRRGLPDRQRPPGSRPRQSCPGRSRRRQTKSASSFLLSLSGCGQPVIQNQQNRQRYDESRESPLHEHIPPLPFPNVSEGCRQNIQHGPYQALPISGIGVRKLRGTDDRHHLNSSSLSSAAPTGPVPSAAPCGRTGRRCSPD